MRRPVVYLFDDSFSALDLATDARLRAALRPVVRDATVLSWPSGSRRSATQTGSSCSRTARVVGDGTHEALLDDNPTYQEIVDSQLTTQGVRRMSERQRPQRHRAGRRSARAAGDWSHRADRGPGRPGRGPMGGGMVGQKAMDFGPSARRLVARLRPERTRAVGIVVLAVVSVALTVLGPRLLGRATDLVFAGYFGRQFPAAVAPAGPRAGPRRSPRASATCSPRSTSPPASASTSAPWRRCSSWS